MASASTLRRTRTGFLVVAMLAFLAAGGLFFVARQAGRPPDRSVTQAAPPDRGIAQPTPPVAVRPGHNPARAPPPRSIEAIPPTTAAAPTASPLSSLSAYASLSTAVIALLGFVITSVMSVRRERRDSALFAIDLEMKRAQLAEMQAKGGKATAG